MAACCDLGELTVDDHVVPSSLSERCDTVITNLLEEGMEGRRWRNEMSKGCATIWATQLGFRAGMRRDRDDLVRIGEVTAEGESESVRDLFWDAAFGSFDTHSAAIPGFPALFMSGTLGNDSIDAWLFRKGVDEFVKRGWNKTLRPRENAGLAALLAEYHRLDPEEQGERIDEARHFAGRIEAERNAVFHSLAWAAIARASGDAEDLERARRFAESAAPLFDVRTGGIELPREEGYLDILSQHLTMIHALADLATIDPSGGWRRSALDLLDYVFSDAYFDGSHIMHDRVSGERSTHFCSGCNFMAIYLADRLHGDTLLFKPLPEPTIEEADMSWHRVARYGFTMPASNTFEISSPKAGFKAALSFETAERKKPGERRISLVITPERGSPCSGEARIVDGGTATISAVPDPGEGKTFRYTLEFQDTGDAKFPFKVLVDVEEGE